MPVVVIANPKGGVGKSTLSTQVAGYFARRGYTTMLGDYDRQQSSRHWLAQRSPLLPAISGWDMRDEGRTLRPPPGTTHVVIDTPAGLRGKRLSAVVAVADMLLVPLQPSVFDIQATHDFLDELLAEPRAGAVRMGLVAMRAKDHTIANDRLHDYTARLPLPLLATLRDTQNYVHLTAQGLTLWDVAPGRVARDLAQWQPLLEWLEAAP